jgi:hypothetical protein
VLASDEHGDHKLIEVITYDPRAKVYRRWVFGKDAFSFESTGTWDVENETVTWVREQPGAGKDMCIRTTAVGRFASDGSYESTSTTTQGKEVLFRFHTTYTRTNAAKVP